MIDRGLERLFNLNRTSKRLVQVLADCLLIGLSFAAAMALRLEGFGFITDASAWSVLLIVIPVSIVVFMRLGFYRAVIRYITGRALKTILVGVFISAATMSVSVAVLDLSVPTSVPGIYALLMLVTVGGVRFGLRTLVMIRKTRSKENVLIFGAGEAGRQLLNALNQGPEYSPVAFIDDRQDLQGAEMCGLPVHSVSDLEPLISASRVKAVLLAIPSASRSRRRLVMERLTEFPVEVRTIPGMADIVSGKAKVNDLKVVSIDELLGRDPVPPMTELMETNIRDRTVLVSGAGGSIGSELCRQILDQSPKALILLDVSEPALYSIDDELQRTRQEKSLATEVVPILGSVQNAAWIQAVLQTFRVQTIYHAAAYKHVPLVEQNILEGLRNNVFGTQAIAEAAVQTGVEAFTLVSTDKAVRPTNIMGASKRMAELVCQALAKKQSATKFSMVRFGNVLGSSGSVIPRFREQIERGGPITVTHPEITRFFMTIPEAAQLVIQAGAMAKGGDVFVLDMGEPVKIAELAQRMIRLHGLTPYFLDAAAGDGTGHGDIGIAFTGLRRGEKLFEELLIGKDSVKTAHPRIKSATEVSLDSAPLMQVIDKLLKALQTCDVQAVRQVLLDAPTGYQPIDDISDLLWNQRGVTGAVDPKVA